MYMYVRVYCVFTARRLTAERTKNVTRLCREEPVRPSLAVEHSATVT